MAAGVSTYLLCGCCSAAHPPARQTANASVKRMLSRMQGSPESAPAIPAGYVDEDFPNPGEDAENQKRPEIVSCGHIIQQPMGGPATDGDVQARPEDHRADECQNCTHWLYVNARNHLSAH